MAREGSFPGETSGRIDRILIRSKVYRPSEIKIVGDQPLPDDPSRFPSDHFGLTGRLVPQTETNE